MRSMSDHCAKRCRSHTSTVPGDIQYVPRTHWTSDLIGKDHVLAPKQGHSGSTDVYVCRSPYATYRDLKLTSLFRPFKSTREPSLLAIKDINPS